MEKTGQLQNNYWIEFYKKNSLTKNPSDFCLFVCKNYNLKNKKILELCCGDGRDSYHLSQKCIQIVALDKAIKIKETNNLKSLKMDIFDFYKNNNQIYDVTYCRFGLHSVSEDIEDVIFKNSREIYFEFRSDKDDSYINDHYRRKINGNNIVKKIIDFGFQLLYYKESKDLAVYKEQNPVIIRIIAKKENQWQIENTYQHYQNLLIGYQ